MQGGGGLPAGGPRGTLHKTGSLFFRFMDALWTKLGWLDTRTIGPGLGGVLATSLLGMLDHF